MSAPGSKSTGLLYGFLGVAAFSLTLPATRVAVGGLGVAQVAAWRAIVAAVVALAILLILRPARPRGRQWWQLVGCAAGVVFGFPVFTTLAMDSVSASHGAVVVGLLPLSTALVGVAIAGERPPIPFWAALGAGTLLTLGFTLRQAEGGLATGHLYLLLAVATAGLGYALGGLLARTLGGWVVACWSLVVSLPVLVPVALVVPPPSLDIAPGVLGAFLYLALVSQLAGFFAWYRGMALAGIAATSQIQLLQLFMTVGVSMAFLGEPRDPEILVFGAGVVAAVAIGTRYRLANAAADARSGPESTAGR